MVSQPMQFNTGFRVYRACNSGLQERLALNKGFKLSARLMVLMFQYYQWHSEAIQCRNI